MAELAILNHHDPDKGIWLFENPNAPAIKNPTALEQSNLDAWWNAVMELAEKIREEQRHIPGWLPSFRVVNI